MSALCIGLCLVNTAQILLGTEVWLEQTLCGYTKVKSLKCQNETNGALQVLWENFQALCNTTEKTCKDRTQDLFTGCLIVMSRIDLVHVLKRILGKSGDSSCNLRGWKESLLKCTAGARTTLHSAGAWTMPATRWEGGRQVLVLCSFACLYQSHEQMGTSHQGESIGMSAPHSLSSYCLY